MRKIILFLLIPSICYAASMSGIGDMRKSVYDSDKDGVVEYADNVSDADFGDVTITAGDWAVENAATVTNATFTTALTVDTGTLTLTADVANNSVLTIGAGAVSVSGANTGDDDVPDAGDFGAGTDLDANGAVAWGNLAEGELTDSTIVSADIKDGVVTEADLNVTNAPGAGEDNYVLTYNHGGTNFTWAADADSGAPTLDSVQSPDGATAWTLADTETIAITTSQNTAGTVLTINNSVADVTGNVYLLDLDYSVDDDQANADFIKCQDAGGVVLSVQENGNTLIAGTLGVTGAITGDLTGDASGSSGSCTGNAATATALATERAIGGVNFDGTAAITPTTIVVADTEDATTFVGLWTDATGSLLPKTDEQITYVGNTGILTAAGFAGALTGNVTGDCTGTSATFTGSLSGDVTSTAMATDITESVLGVGGTDTIFPADPDADKYLMWDDDPGALTWETVSAAGATTALDNLASVQINTTLLSDTADTDSLGTVDAEWLNLYIGDAGKIYLGLGQDASIERSAANEMTLTATSGVTVESVKMMAEQ